MTEKAKKENRFLRKKFKGEGHNDLRLMIINNFSTNVDLIEEFKKMESWCASKHKKCSMLRFNNWVKNSIKFKEQRRGTVITNNELDELKRQTQERLNQFQRPKWETNEQ